jgi:hypothetical protein
MCGKSPLRGIEVVFADAADRTDPVLGKFVKGNIAIVSRVVFIPADITDIALHVVLLAL